MKKLIMFIVLLSSLFILVSCIEEDLGEIPVFSGVEDKEYLLGDTFDPLLGITAVDQDGNDLTELIEVDGLDDMGLFNNTLANVGKFTLTFTVTDENGLTAMAEALITVINPEDIDLGLYGCDAITQGDYVLTWCDEFTDVGFNFNAHGVNLDKWRFQIGTGSQYGLTNWGNNEQQYYREQNARVEDGRLIIEAKRESYAGKNYTSARLWTQPTFSQTYGRFEASIKLPAGDGMWPAFWMLPQNSPYGGWARGGEIDIMEARGRLPRQATGAIHFGDTWPNNTYSSNTYFFPTGTDITDFNEYAVEWEEGVIRWYVNGINFYTLTNWYATGFDFPAPFDVNFYLILNLAIGGNFDGNILPPDSLFDEPVLMEVEYVRVYQKQN